MHSEHLMPYSNYISDTHKSKVNFPSFSYLLSVQAPQTMSIFSMNVVPACFPTLLGNRWLTYVTLDWQAMTANFHVFVVRSIKNFNLIHVPMKIINWRTAFNYPLTGRKGSEKTKSSHDNTVRPLSQSLTPMVLLSTATEDLGIKLNTFQKMWGGKKKQEQKHIRWEQLPSKPDASTLEKVKKEHLVASAGWCRVT